MSGSTAAPSGLLEPQEDRAPDFAQHIFAISGVSGGSIGAAVFHALDRARDSRVAAGSIPDDAPNKTKEVASTSDEEACTKQGATNPAPNCTRDEGRFFEVGNQVLNGLPRPFIEGQKLPIYLLVGACDELSTERIKMSDTIALVCAGCGATVMRHPAMPAPGRRCLECVQKAKNEVERVRRETKAGERVSGKRRHLG